jgi:hypothetical protein
MYVTEPITFPDGKFKIVADGLGDENQKLILATSPTFQAIDTSNSNLLNFTIKILGITKFARTR